MQAMDRLNIQKFFSLQKSGSHPHRPGEFHLGYPFRRSGMVKDVGRLHDAEHHKQGQDDSFIVFREFSNLPISFDVSSVSGAEGRCVEMRGVEGVDHVPQEIAESSITKVNGREAVFVYDAVVHTDVFVDDAEMFSACAQTYPEFRVQPPRPCREFSYRIGIRSGYGDSG